MNTMNKQTQFGIELPMMRDPVVATSLSLIPGLGQIYNLEPRKGVLFFFVAMTNVVLISTLTWSQQLVKSLSGFSQEFNVVPNSDIVHALSNFHAGSPALTVLFGLFIAFIAYAMRDAHDKARTVKRQAIYASSSMHIDEATSGSYLVHAAMMVTLVLFAFFFLLPSPPNVQITEISFVKTEMETAKPKTPTKNKATHNNDAVRNPNIKRIENNPEKTSTGGPRANTVERTSPAKPKTESKPEVKPEAQKQPTPNKTEKPAEAAPKPAEPAKTPAQPRVNPISQPASMNPTPSPLQPTPLKPVPPTPTLGQPTNSSKVPAVDPSKFLSSLMPAAATTSGTQAPSPQSLNVKSAHGAPLLVASNIALPGANAPQPGIATSSRPTNSTGPKIIEAGGRIGKPGNGPLPKGAPSGLGKDLAMISPDSSNPRSNDSSTRGTGPSDGPSPSRPGPKGPDDLGGGGGISPVKPVLPGGENGPKKEGRTGTPDHGKIGTLPRGDAEAVNFGPYMAELQRRIKRAWFPPHDLMTKRVTVRFNISSNGELSNLKLSRSCGSALADNAALKAVANAAPFPSLPKGSPNEVDIEFTFDYNVFKGGGQGVMRGY